MTNFVNSSVRNSKVNSANLAGVLHAVHLC